MIDPSENAGFSGPSSHELGGEGRTVALAELATVVGLAVSTVVAATVVTVGIARASVVDVVHDDGSVVMMALLVGIAFLGLGGVSVLTGFMRQRQ